MRATIEEVLSNVSTSIYFLHCLFSFAYFNLNDLEALHTLDLANFKVDDDGARTIAKFLFTDKFIKRLNMNWNTVWTDGGM